MSSGGSGSSPLPFLPEWPTSACPVEALQKEHSLPKAPHYRVTELPQGICFPSEIHSQLNVAVVLSIPNASVAPSITKPRL